MSGAERVVIPASQTPEDPDHAARMIAKADGVTLPDPVVPEARPAWLPEKFKTVEEMAASYKELESRLGAPKPAEAAPVVTPAVVPEVTPVVADPAAAVVASAGLDMAALQTEFTEAGALSEASLAKLAAAGIDKATVDTYIAGRQAVANAFQADVLSVVPGGAEKYPEMLAWAKVNLTPAEQDAFNTAVSTSNPEQAKLAVTGLGAKFTAAVGSEPNLAGGRGDSAAGDVFESVGQMKAAMRDPRYETDSAYRKSVGEKLGRSNIF